MPEDAQTSEVAAASDPQAPTNTAPLPPFVDASSMVEGSAVGGGVCEACSTACPQQEPAAGQDGEPQRPQRGASRVLCGFCTAARTWKLGKFVKTSGLKEVYAEECLSANEWDFERARQDVEALKVRLSQGHCLVLRDSYVCPHVTCAMTPVLPPAMVR